MLWINFFFQAEDGIRDADVTGVQTCALPISVNVKGDPVSGLAGLVIADQVTDNFGLLRIGHGRRLFQALIGLLRSEERRVGKECRSRWERELMNKIDLTTIYMMKSTQIYKRT